MRPSQNLTPIILTTCIGGGGGLSAHDIVFIFFFLIEIFKSSVFTSFQDAIFIFENCHNL